MEEKQQSALEAGGEFVKKGTYIPWYKRSNRRVRTKRYGRKPPRLLIKSDREVAVEAPGNQLLIKSNREVTVQQSSGASLTTNGASINTAKETATLKSNKRQSSTRQRSRKVNMSQRPASESSTTLPSGQSPLGTQLPLQVPNGTQQLTNKAVSTGESVVNKAEGRFQRVTAPPATQLNNRRQRQERRKRNRQRRQRGKRGGQSTFVIKKSIVHLQVKRSDGPIHTSSSTSLNLVTQCPIKVEVPSSGQPRISSFGRAFTPPSHTQVHVSPVGQGMMSEVGFGTSTYLSESTSSRSYSSDSSMPSAYMHVHQNELQPLIYPSVEYALQSGASTSGCVYPSKPLTGTAGVSPNSLESSKETSRGSPDSVFNRLDSPTKYRQTRLQFSRVMPPRGDANSPPAGVLRLSLDRDHHHAQNYNQNNSPRLNTDRFVHPRPSCEAPCSTSIVGNPFTPHAYGDYLPNVKLESDHQGHSYHQSSNIHPSRRECMFSEPISDGLIKLEPSTSSRVMMPSKSESTSPALYKQIAAVGLSVGKMLHRFAPKGCQIERDDRLPQSPTYSSRTFYERPDNHFPPTNSLQSTAPSSSASAHERGIHIDLTDSAVVQQMPGNSQEGSLSQSTISPFRSQSTGLTQFRDDQNQRYMYADDSSGIQIPLSKMGLKVVAIDCEMVGCVKVNQMLPEMVLANQVARSRDGMEAQRAKKGLLGYGVLLKTRMKPPAPSKKALQKKKNKELSIAGRCSIIGYDGSVLYDKYIDPTVDTDYKIINFRTPWSGIRPFHMKGATPFKVAREEILNILCDCIVVGHHIWTDFHSLEVETFPASKIRDTSTYPALKKKAGLPIDKQPGGLKKMTLALLGRHIQKRSRVGHCSVEDAQATMDLYKLVELEWES